jgi:acylphosphatase
MHIFAMANCHVFICGRVQGVGYRDAFCDEARRRRVTGWVRNRRDGTVEALLQGSPEDVDAVLRWARVGPPAARVTEVRIVPDTEPVPSRSDFVRLPTD